MKKNKTIKENKLPIVSVYITPKELKRLIDAYVTISSIVGKGEKLLESRVDGRINYHDLKKIISQAQKELLEKARKIAKENWNKVNSLNPDSQEYSNKYNEAQVVSEFLETLIKSLKNKL